MATALDTFTGIKALGNTRTLASQARAISAPAAESVASLQDQVDRLLSQAQAAIAEVFASIPDPFTTADAETYGFRKVTVYPVLLAADTAISHAAPALSGEELIVDIRQNGTGGYNVTWGATFRGGPTELGVLLANTRYLVSFRAIDIGGTLTWVKYSEQLAY